MSKFNIKAAFVIGGSILADQRRIDGVSVITEGPALGHGVWIDSTSLETVKTCAEEYRGGLKVKMNHHSGAEAIVGTLKSFRIEGVQLKADLQLLSNHPLTPLVLEMAETMPESFGLSISFSGQIEEGDKGAQLMRCLEIYSCDIVDQPAANPTGLFSKFDTPQNTTMIIETPEYLSLQAEHKTATAAIATLTADLEASVSANKDLNAKLNEATLNLEAAHASIENLKSERQKDATVHAVAIADFEKKVALASQNQLAATGTQPVDLGTVTGAVNHSDIYEAFSKADPIKAKEMFDNPETNKIIRAESKRRNTITK
jgi:hypothetical protein